jgi:ribosomal-protein-alanine acetyltransferase
MRDMTQADVAAVWRIEQAVQAYPWGQSSFAEVLQNGCVCRLDERDGDICSYAVLMPIVDEAELLTLGVAANQQRRGLGMAMLQQILDIARQQGLRRVFLEVRTDNAAAIALYRKAGFVEVGMRCGYYVNAQGSADALVMARDLTVEQHG